MKFSLINTFHPKIFMKIDIAINFQFLTYKAEINIANDFQFLTFSETDIKIIVTNFLTLLNGSLHTKKKQLWVLAATPSIQITHSLQMCVNDFLKN